MNALDYLLADIKAAHAGQKLPRRPAACPQGQATRPAKPRAAKAIKPAAAPTAAARPALPAPEETPAIARALATLRAELRKVQP